MAWTARTPALFIALLVLLRASPSIASFRRIDPVEAQQRLLRLKIHLPLANFKQMRTFRHGPCQYTDFTADVIDPENHAARSVRIHEVRPRRQTQQLPTIVVVPTIEGKTLLEETLAQSLCEDNFVAYIADVYELDQPKELPAQGLEDRANRNAVIAVRSVVSEVLKQPWVRPDQLAIIGNSLGGIMTSMIAAAEDRLRAFVVAGAAGNLPYVLAYSDARVIAELRDRRMQALNMEDQKSYEEWLARTLVFDPLHFADHAPRSRIYMIRITNDTHVPSVKQFELWEALGGPRFDDYNWGHVGSLLGLNFLYYRSMTDFIRSRFESY
jgi:dienelactone hydrolase